MLRLGRVPGQIGRPVIVVIAARTTDTPDIDGLRAIVAAGRKRRRADPGATAPLLERLRGVPADRRYLVEVRCSSQC
ncbi:hypothetical protein Cma02nite_28250 [Cellulomonas marina]|nr:hypothetical protein Cma02nite_28250 [Cellulomonas marina]